MDWTGIDNRLREVDKTWAVAPISETLYEIMKGHPDLSFADLELRFRAIESHTFLVAMPVGNSVIPQPRGLKVRFLLKEKSGTGPPAKFWLWVCINGEEEVEDLLQHLGIPRTQNLANLVSCGVLVKPS